MAKPRGPTSHDVVDTVRRVLGESRVGHLGTLDPFAEGLLVIVVGRATRLAPFAAGWRKSYDGVIRLGAVTATDDATGPVTAASDGARVLAADAVRAAARGFVGEQEQRPPAFSAVKVDGERAYRRARRGEAPVLRPRRITVFALEVTAWRPPDAEFRATVSGGTYLRSLARDLGERLACGGHLAALRRTRVGPFALEDAVAPDALSAADLKDPALLVDDLPRRELDGDERDAVVHGRPIPAREIERGSVALMAGGRLLSVGDVEDGRIKPRLVLEDA